MMDWSKAILYTTEPDTCVIGCGAPLIILKTVATDEVLYFCPSCEGIWRQDLFLSNNPRLLTPEDFSEGDVTLAVEIEALKMWRGKLIAQEGDEKQYYIGITLKVFGSRFYINQQ